MIAKIRPQVLLISLILAAIAIVAIFKHETEIATGCVTAIAAISPKLLDKD